MASKFAFFAFVVSSAIVTQIAGQYTCRFSAVNNIQLRDDILTWNDVDYEICNISYYIVNIENLKDSTEYAFQVTDRKLDATFLPPCQEYRFTVTQVSTEGLQGASRLLFATTTPPPEVDLTIQYLRLTQYPTYVHLSWGLLDEWQSCATRYRILTYNEDQDIPEDLYVVGPGIGLSYLMPCTSYTFAVTAMYNIEDEGPPSVIRYQMPGYETTAPMLSRVTPTSTSVEITWSVQSYLRNRCRITSFNVNAAPYFAISFPVQDDPDNRQPVSINIPGLTPNTMYYFNVSVTNSAGISPGTIVFIQTSDRD